MSSTETLHQELLLEPGEISASLLCPAEVATGIWSSERHRPESERNQLNSDLERAMHDAMDERVAAGQSPDEFAAEVFAGIAEERFWLVPDAGLEEGLRSRTESILAKTAPPGAFSD